MVIRKRFSLVLRNKHQFNAISFTWPVNIFIVVANAQAAKNMIHCEFEFKIHSKTRGAISRVFFLSPLRQGQVETTIRNFFRFLLF